MRYNQFIDEISIIVKNRKGYLHRPILLLLILADVYKYGSSNYFKFIDYEQRIKDMLYRFGTQETKNYQPQYPFYFMKSSSFWHLDDVELLHEDAPSRKEMLNATAKIDNDLYCQLQEDPAMVINTIHFILNECWTDNIHANILEFLKLHMNQLYK